jgi:hypothetical protein
MLSAFLPLASVSLLFAIACNYESDGRRIAPTKLSHLSTVFSY